MPGKSHCFPEVLGFFYILDSQLRKWLPPHRVGDTESAGEVLFKSIMQNQKSPPSFCSFFYFSSTLQDICPRSYSNSEIAAFSPEENYLSVLVTYDSSLGGWSHPSPWGLLCFVFLLCLEEMGAIFDNRQCHGGAVSEQPHIWEPTPGCSTCREENWNSWERIPEPDWDILRLLYQRSHWCWSKHTERQETECQHFQISCVKLD